MISSPCSAEQAQRIKLCPRKSPQQSFPPIAQQAPGHFVRGLCCSQAAQPAAEAAGARPASNEIDAESPRTAVRGVPLRFIQNPPRSRSRTSAGELEWARPASNEIHAESPRTAGRGFPCASSKTRRAAGHAQPQGSSRGQSPPRMRSIQKALEPNRFGGFLHPLFLLLRIQCTLACFCRRLRQSAIMAMNSEFVGLPLMFETV